MKKISALVFSMAAILFSAETVEFVTPVHNDTKVFQQEKSEIGAAPLFSVAKQEVLKVVVKSGVHLKVENVKGEQGWILASQVTPATSSKEQFAEQSVQGSTEDSPAVILAPETAESTPAIIPDRSFTDKLKVDQNKESLPN